MKKWFFLSFILMTVGVFAECPVIPVEVPQPSEKAIRFYHSGNVLWIIKQLWTLAVPAIVVFTGLSARIRNFSRFIGRKKVFTFILFLIVYSVLVAALTLPLDFYSGYLRPHQYGLSTQSIYRFVHHYVLGFGISLITSLIIFGILYLLIAKSPKRWWFYAGLIMVPVTLFFMIVQPIFVAPLFNKFGPMKDQALEQKILDLAHRAGIENSRVFEVDKSADTKAVNAYVTGIGSSKRIVLWDTTIKTLDEDELLFVMGHEMGHYVLHHIWWLIAFETVMSFVIFYLIHVTAHFFIRRFSSRMGIIELKDVASLPLFLLLYAFFSLVFAPLSTAFSRYFEHEADRFGLEITHDNHAAATGFLKLSDTNLGYPYPDEWVMWFRGTHPSIGSRIEFFNTYHPWCENEPSRYEKYFKNDQKKVP